MKLTYNGVVLTDLGPRCLVLGGQRHDFDAPAEGSAHRRRVTLPVALHFNRADDFAANRALVLAVLTAVNTSPGRLTWTDDAGTTTYLDREVMVAANGLPEDPNAIVGADYQAIELAFSYYENLTPDALTSSVTGDGLAAVALGNVLGFTLNGRQARFSEWRDNRSRVGGSLAMSGKLLAPTTSDLAARRTWLDAAHADLRAALGKKSTRVIHGAFNQLARVGNFSVVINQEEWSVDWSFDADYTLFPSETSYQVAELRVKTNEDKAAGTVTLSLSGRILSESEAHARAMLGTLRTSFAPAATWQVRRSDTDAQQASSSVEGTTFLELSFDEQFTKLAAGNITGEALTMSDAEETKAGDIRRTYAGFVECKAATWDAAYQAAVTRAKVLGDDKHVFRLGGRISVTDSQQRANRLTTGDYLVRVEFSWEYTVRGPRVFVELRRETSTAAFGPNSLSVSGFIVAPDETTARTHYATLLTAYTTTFRRDERVSVADEWIDLRAGAAVGATRTPAESSTWGEAVNTSATSAGGFAKQFKRLEFGFTQLVEKVEGQEIAVRYELRTSADLKTRVLRIEAGGEAFGRTTADAEWAVTTLMTVLAPAGKRVGYTRGEARERWFGAKTGEADDRPTEQAGERAGGYLVGTTFTENYEGAVAAQAGLLECELSETVRPSTPRLVVHAAAFTRDVPQYCGIQSGRRSIRGRCSACDETTARTWAKAQKNLTLPGLAPGATRYWLPDELTVTWRAPTMTELVARGDTSNVMVAEAQFQFEEVLPEYDTLA
jgi:hypothetical protein